MTNGTIGSDPQGPLSSAVAMVGFLPCINEPYTPNSNELDVPTLQAALRPPSALDHRGPGCPPLPSPSPPYEATAIATLDSVDHHRTLRTAGTYRPSHLSSMCTGARLCPKMPSYMPTPQGSGDEIRKQRPNVSDSSGESYITLRRLDPYHIT